MKAKMIEGLTVLFCTPSLFQRADIRQTRKIDIMRAQHQPCLADGTRGHNCEASRQICGEKAQQPKPSRSTDNYRGVILPEKLCNHSYDFLGPFHVCVVTCARHDL